MMLCSNLLADEMFAITDTSNVKHWNWSSSLGSSGRSRSPRNLRVSLSSRHRNPSLHGSSSSSSSHQNLRVSLSSSQHRNPSLRGSSSSSCWNLQVSLSSSRHSLRYRNPSLRRSSRHSLSDCGRLYLSSSCNVCFSNTPILSTSRRALSFEKMRYVTQCLVFDSIVTHDVHPGPPYSTNSKRQPTMTTRYANLSVLLRAH